MATTVTNTRSKFLDTLRNKVKEMSSPQNYKKDDNRYWKPEIDKAGNGSAIIRFLPTKQGEEFPFVQLYTHGFQGNGKWFIENCPTSTSDTCPACEANSALWNSGSEADKNLARSRKRKLNYISNVLVISDPKNPDNNGKVFLYRYGKKIWDKMKDLIDPPPEFADMEPVDPFCPFEGVNFRLRIVKQDGFPNYDKSTFDAPSALFNGDEKKIQKVLEQLISLNEIIDPKQFKSYDDLKANFNRVTGEGLVSQPRQRAAAPKTEEAPEENVEETKPVARSTGKKTTPKPAAPKADEAPVTEGTEEDDFFANLAKDEDE